MAFLALALILLGIVVYFGANPLAGVLLAVTGTLLAAWTVLRR